MQAALTFQLSSCAIPSSVRGGYFYKDKFAMLRPLPNAHILRTIRVFATNATLINASKQTRFQKYNHLTTTHLTRNYTIQYNADTDSPG